LDGERIKLSRKAAAILAHLISHRQRWVSRCELKDEFWKDTNVEDGSIDKQISIVRAALGDNGASYVETRYKEGQFVAQGKFRNPPAPLSTPTNLPPPGGKSKERISSLLRYPLPWAAVLLLAAAAIGAFFTIWAAPKRAARPYLCRFP
jgi:hypothetical protein